jgi:hypothetical protein
VKTIGASQLKGQHIFVQHRPEMGFTALSRSLGNAIHDYKREEVPIRMHQKTNADFEEFAWNGQANN